jgi:hypothetical protein
MLVNRNRALKNGADSELVLLNRIVLQYMGHGRKHAQDSWTPERRKNL